MAGFNGKVAVVTGSTSGIGLGIAHHLAAQGCSVILTGLIVKDQIPTLLDDFRSKYSGRVEFVEGDLRETEAILLFCDKVLEIFPDGVDILVNNAGIQHVCNIDEYPLQKWNEMISISLTAPFLMIKQFLPQMKQKSTVIGSIRANPHVIADDLLKKWGRIISMSSQMGIISQIGKAPYSAVKSGLIGLSKGVALETAPLGITCNCICPGFVDAPIVHGFINELAAEKNISYEAAKTLRTTKSPTKQLTTIDQVAEMVLFLCSSTADNITGTHFLMDGGYTAM